MNSDAGCGGVVEFGQGEMYWLLVMEGDKWGW